MSSVSSCVNKAQRPVCKIVLWMVKDKGSAMVAGHDNLAWGCRGNGRRTSRTAEKSRARLGVYNNFRPVASQ